MAGYPAKSVAGTTFFFLSIPLEEYQVHGGRPSSGEENQVGKSEEGKGKEGFGDAISFLSFPLMSI